MQQQPQEGLVGDLQYPIDEQEIMLQSFGMDSPNVVPRPEHFTREQFEAAHQVVTITDLADQKMQVNILDDGMYNVSRDVLAAYKTLLYRVTCNYNEQVRFAKYLSHSCCVLVVALILIIGTLYVKA